MNRKLVLRPSCYSQYRAQMRYLRLPPRKSTDLLEINTDGVKHKAYKHTRTTKTIRFAYSYRLTTCCTRRSMIRCRHLIEYSPDNIVSRTGTNKTLPTRKYLHESSVKPHSIPYICFEHHQNSTFCSTPRKSNIIGTPSSGVQPTLNYY